MIPILYIMIFSLLFWHYSHEKPKTKNQGEPHFTEKHVFIIKNITIISFQFCSWNLRFFYLFAITYWNFGIMKNSLLSESFSQSRVFSSSVVILTHSFHNSFSLTQQNKALFSLSSTCLSLYLPSLLCPPSATDLKQCDNIGVKERVKQGKALEEQMKKSFFPSPYPLPSP